MEIERKYSVVDYTYSHDTVMMMNDVIWDVNHPVDYHPDRDDNQKWNQSKNSSCSW